MNKNLLIYFVLLLLLGCTVNKVQQEPKKENGITLRDALNSNIGSTAASLVSRMGPPSEERSDYDGGKILIYKHKFTRHYSKGPKYVPNEKNPLAFKLDYSDSIESYEDESYIMFWINQDNIIYKWSSKNVDLDIIIK